MLRDSAGNARELRVAIIPTANNLYLLHLFKMASLPVKFRTESASRGATRATPTIPGE
jgi:hypothetical protein